MSYILEALKMSEQSRRQGAAATDYSLLPPMVEEDLDPGRSRRRNLVAGGLLLVNVVAMVYWLRPAWSDSVAAAPAAKPLPPVVQVTTAGPPPLAAAVPAPLPPLAAVAVTPPIAVAKVVLPPATPRPPSHPAVPEPDAGRVAVVAAPEPAPAKAEPAPEPVTADGIPVSVQKQLPPIAVAGYIHDGGDNNMVIVNDKLLREGDEIAPGLKLEKIFDDRVLLNYKGYRFKR